MIKLDLTLGATAVEYGQRISGIVVQVRAAYVKIDVGGGRTECVRYSSVIGCIATHLHRGYTTDVRPSEILAFLNCNFKDSTMNDFPMPAPRPVAPTPAQTGPERLAKMEAALAAEVAKQNKAELVAIKRQAVAADLALVHAQGKLLSCIDTMLQGHQYTQPLAELAEHAKALKPMAEAHGFKIVLIGDKSLATVVAI